MNSATGVGQANECTAAKNRAVANTTGPLTGATPPAHDGRVNRHHRQDNSVRHGGQ